MPNTPQVNFNFYNNNVQNSTPLLGVSYVLARTTKGPFNDPSQLIRSYSQFQRIFGNEIVPDGSVSNIKKALELGSILRVSRVAGAGNTTYGEAKPGTNVEASTTSIKSAEWEGSGGKPDDDTAKMYYYFNTNNQVSLKFTCNFSQSTPEGKLGDEPITFEYLGNINGQNTWVTKYSNQTYKASTTVVIQDFRYGGFIYSNTKNYMHWTGSSPETVLNDREPFLVPNSVVDNGDGTFSENTVQVDPTALHTFYSNGAFVGEEFAVLDRSYLKLRDLSLAYQLPSSLVQSLNMSSIRLALNASNILLWTPNENVYIDPETTTFGNDISAKFGEFNANPSNQFYTFSVTLNF